MKDAWTVVESRFVPSEAKAYEGVFTLGSGYLHVRGSLEEHLADEPQNLEYVRRAANVTSERFRDVAAQWGTYVPGVFAPHPSLNNEMVNLPWPIGIAPIVDGERLDVARCAILAYRRELSLRDATLRRTLVWRTAGGAEVEVTFERFVSAVRPHLVVQRMLLRSDRPCEVVVEAAIDADVRTNGHDHFVDVRATVGDDGAMHCAIATDGGDRVSIDGAAWIESTDGVRRFRAREGRAPRACVASVRAAAAPGAQLVAHKRTCFTTSRDASPIDSRESLDDACSQSFESLHAEHAAEWDRRWSSCDVEIDGDSTAQKAARLAIFHLLRCRVPDDRVAIDAKGYAGEAYWGRYFWDTEMYLLPFFLYTQPAKARTLVDFRVRTLDGARRNATRYGYRGARYAWESDHRGDECCPNWQYADHEVHVTADVAYGIAHRAAAVDGGRVDEGAATVLVETARYWMERITFDDRAALSRPRLLGVMGPDEYKPITNDNAYTNRLVAFAFDAAARHGAIAGADDAERATWSRVARELRILRDSRDHSLVLQCEGFDEFADPEFERLWVDRSRTFAAQVAQERIYRSKCLKQADVLMLMALFPSEFSDAEVRRAWDYYLPYTTHDSSLSPGAHCLVSCRLGLDDDAWRWWTRGSRLDLPRSDGGEHGAAEGIHIAAAGATWQMLVFGFAGCSSALQANELTLSPRLPRAWTRLAFPLVWSGQRVRVEIGRAATTIANDSDRPLAARVRGERRTIAPARSETFA